MLVFIGKAGIIEGAVQFTTTNVALMFQRAANVNECIYFLYWVSAGGRDNYDEPLSLIVGGIYRNQG